MGTPVVWTRSGRQWRTTAPAGAGPAGSGTQPGGRGLHWLRLSSTTALADAAEEHGVPAALVAKLRARDAGVRRARPHLEPFNGGGLHLVVPTLAYHDPSDVVTGEVTCVVVGSTVLTAETGEGGVLDGLEQRLGEPQMFPDARTAGLLSALLATVVEGAGDVEDALARAVVELEDVIFAPTTDAPVERLYQVKREIAEARRALVPLSVELPELITEPDAASPGDAWVRRLVAAVDRLDRRLEDHDELLADMLSAHLALVSVAQNEQMRTISAWAATLAIPTLVGTIYGMNFVHMPELDWRFGYPLALLVMAGLGAVVNAAFRRSGWL